MGEASLVSLGVHVALRVGRVVHDLHPEVIPLPALLRRFGHHLVNHSLEELLVGHALRDVRGPDLLVLLNIATFQKPCQKHTKHMPKPCQNHTKSIQKTYQNHTKIMPNLGLVWFWSVSGMILGMV